MIPQADRLWLAAVEAPELHRRVREPWTDNAFRLDLRAGGLLAANTWARGEIQPSQLLTEPASCGALDYTRLERRDFASEAAAPVIRPASGSTTVRPSAT